MKIKEYSSMAVGGTSLVVPFQVPESVEEFDQNAKRSGACLEEAINNVVYRGSLASWRDLFLHGVDVGGATEIKGVEQKTGIQRKTKTVELSTKNEDGSHKFTEAWDETEANYFKRVCAETARNNSQTLEAVVALFQPVATEVAGRVPFDASESEKRAPTSKTPPKDFLRAAQTAIDAGKGEILASILTNKLGKTVLATVEALGFGMKEDEDNEKRARRESLLASL